MGRCRHQNCRGRGPLICVPLIGGLMLSVQRPPLAAGVFRDAAWK